MAMRATGFQRRLGVGKVFCAFFQVMVGVADKEKIDRLIGKFRIVRPSQDEFSRIGSVHVDDALFRILQHLRFHIDRIDFACLCHRLDESPSEVAGP